MRTTLLLSMALAGLAAQAQATDIKVRDAAELRATAQRTTSGGAPIADGAAALTANDVASLSVTAGALWDRDDVARDFHGPVIRNSPAPVPEPSTLPLVTLGLAALAWVGRAQRRAAPIRAA